MNKLEYLWWWWFFVGSWVMLLTGVTVGMFATLLHVNCFTLALIFLVPLVLYTPIMHGCLVDLEGGG